MAGRRCDVLDVREMFATVAARRERASGGEGARRQPQHAPRVHQLVRGEKLLPGDAAALPTAADLEERLARAEPVQAPQRLMASTTKPASSSAPACAEVCSPGAMSAYRGILL
jgi:hypothetical protein